MKKRRIGYDKVFLASPCIEKNAEIINSLSIIILYKVFKDNKEIFLNEYSDYMTPNSFLDCSIDRNKKKYLSFKIKHEKDIKRLGYKIEYEIIEYYKCVYCECKQISKEEFYQILEENIDNFDNSTNQDAQCLAYSIYEVKEQEI